MPDLRIIQERQGAAAYVAAQQQAYVNHQIDHTMKKMMDTLTDIDKNLDRMDEGFVRVNNIHVPGTWEVITNFLSDCCRWIGSLFTGRR